MSHRILLMPHGTTGDVLPFIWLGRQLKQRGHEVSMLWVDMYCDAATRAGIDFVSIEDGGEFQRMSQQASLWSEGESMRQGHAYSDRCIGPCLTAYSEKVAPLGRPDLILGPMISLAARLLREKHGIPFVSTNIQPAPFISAYDLPAGLRGGRLLRKLPVFLRKLILAAASGDFQSMPVLRQCCLDLGVKPPRSLRKDWYHSPDGVLTLFPPWFGKPQPDWPPNTFQWDFPLEDLADESPLSGDLRSFLDTPGKKLIFALGSTGGGSKHAAGFFSAALECTLQLECQAVFICADPTLLPYSLPSSVFVSAYVPYSKLLTRMDAAVHAGGIGTTAQCFAAGVPQLIAHSAFDQPDNAERVERIGAGFGLEIASFSSVRAMPLLRRCLTDETVRSRAAECRQRFLGRPPVTRLLEWLESRAQPIVMP
ncbi:MAG: glycosyltransferase [Verrucomicrobia bacterium]|nr:glycosyltransferase [Verrucomicrobiota bacterium]